MTGSHAGAQAADVASRAQVAGGAYAPSRANAAGAHAAAAQAAPQPGGAHGASQVGGAHAAARESGVRAGRAGASFDAARTASIPATATAPAAGAQAGSRVAGVQAAPRVAGAQGGSRTVGSQAAPGAAAAQRAPYPTGSYSPNAYATAAIPAAAPNSSRAGVSGSQAAGNGFGNGNGSGKGKGKKKAGGPWRVVFIVAMVVFVLAIAALAAIFFSYWQGEQTNKEIEQAGGFTPTATADLSTMKVDWDALRAINPDTVGWIYIPGTTINYPIVQSSDDSYYLKHDFKGSVGYIATFGAIFLEAENKANFSDSNNVIYGHHLNDGSMFAPIADFSDQATFDGSRTVYILTPSGNYRLKTFSLVHCAATDPIVQTQFTNETERVNYVQDKMDRSVVSVSDVPAADNMKRTFAFSTCDNLPSDGRWVLFAYVAESTVSGEAGQDLNLIANADDAAAVNDAVKESTE